MTRVNNDRTLVRQRCSHAPTPAARAPLASTNLARVERGAGGAATNGQNVRPFLDFTLDGGDKHEDDDGDDNVDVNHDAGTGGDDDDSQNVFPSKSKTLSSPRGEIRITFNDAASEEMTAMMRSDATNNFIFSLLSDL